MGGVLAQYELLEQGVGHAAAGANQGALQQQSRAAIRLRIVGIRDGAGGQVAAYIRIVYLPATIVSPGDKWAGDKPERCPIAASGVLIA
ncbi:MAG: hypothetical protein WA708_03770 [Acidobacteriaceae bacterium]